MTWSADAADTIVEARYIEPVSRYGHFALGRPHEYASVTITTHGGRQLSLRLPVDEVFEDLRPRIVRLAAGATAELLTIVSSRSGGARQVLLAQRGARLEISAQSPSIGTPMRWLNPVGVADLDGDGQAEIAAVITPHIGGTLTAYRKRGRRLVEVAALDGFSNHVYGTTELALSAPFSIGGQLRLLVPDAARRQLRVVAFENGRLVQTGACPLGGSVTGPIEAVSANTVSVGLSSGRELVDPANCPP